MAERIVRVGAHLMALVLVATTIGLVAGISFLSERESLAVNRASLWSSRFPESAILRAAVHRRDTDGAWCAERAAAEDGRSGIVAYAALAPNDAKLLLQLAAIAERCAVVTDALLLLRRALAVGASDPRIVSGAYGSRRFLEYTDPALARDLDRHLITLWEQQPSTRPRLSEAIENCWSCKRILAKAHPELAARITEYHRKRRR
ncbi:hypothetical protein [Minwuia thermotolerans]|uniref:Uncharacterized protein n=1 Tax=Minwuia thermotolerans TaxID=2056226 RepID=A0A2M9G7Q9_9PROT|nr:hypothetical protein [Minwuia thermotolerans]PJK31741.1 hypothetical protein CVT23_00010 [Minwuia thermotolerans]